MAGGAKMDAAMGLTMDLRPFLKALTDGQNGGMSASDTELLDALAEEGIHMELRGDLEPDSSISAWAEHFWSRPPACPPTPGTLWI